MIELDGSSGEGGGQFVRLAVALSALTASPIRIVRARAHRPHPGLAPQHLAAVRAVAALCEARCEGLEPRATEFTFEPRARPAGGDVDVRVGTAGSVTLVLQAMLPALIGARHPSRVVVVGGTDVRQAPTWDYLQHVFLRLLARMGLDVRASLRWRGYYPRGGGEVALEVRPGRPRPLLLEQPGRGWHIAGEAHVGNLPLEIAERMRAAALAAAGVPGDIRARALGRDEARGTGGAITAWAECDAGLVASSRVAQRGVRAEALGEEVGRELAADIASGANLDLHAADQVLVFLALASGRSSFAVREVTSHAQTTMELVARFLPVRFAQEPRGALIRITALPR